MGVMAIHLGPALQRSSCGLPPHRPAVRRGLGRATREARRLALLRVEIAAFHVPPIDLLRNAKQI